MSGLTGLISRIKKMSKPLPDPKHGSENERCIYGSRWGNDS